MKPSEQRRRPPALFRLRRTSSSSSYRICLSGEMRRIRITAILFLVFGFSYLVFDKAFDNNNSNRIQYFLPSTHTLPDPADDSLFMDSADTNLETVLKEASMPDNTVILTTLNEAWADPENSVLDLFLESFRIGYQTSKLLSHLVIVALDQKAFMSCKRAHTHCFALITEGADFSQEAYFMTPDYLKMMWLRIDFLRSVLELGYNFLFTDADVMWFRDPFTHFYPKTDFQISCDHYSGNSTDVESNRANGGFSFVRSNVRSIEFYKYWYSSRELYPGLHDQDVLNKIKFDSFLTEINLQIRFLSTAYFGGFCEPSKDLNKVCTMHANCCVGLGNKVHDLRIMLQDWKNYMTLPPILKNSQRPTWRPSNNCAKTAILHTSYNILFFPSSLALRRHFSMSENGTRVEQESIDETPPSDAITPDLPITDSLIMEDEHLDTIPEWFLTKKIEVQYFNKDSEIFSNPLFDSNVDYTSSDDESSSEEDVPVENFKIYSNPLLKFDEGIFSSEINPLYNEVLEDLDLIPPRNEKDHFNTESNLIESLLNKETMITSPKIDFFLEEFVGELALINPIPPGIAETNFDLKEDIRLIKKLLYDNSSPRPPEELNSEISDA
ncbi:retrotransposon protein, putative, ty3-gypsy subclass, partial [Tanacetum coccineum]